MRTLILGLIALLGFAGFGTKNSVTSYSESTNREYEIFIWTASQNEEILGEEINYTGTDDDVKINIHGLKRETGYYTLDKSDYNDFEAGDKDTYKITAKDVGNIDYVQLKVDGTILFTDDWYCMEVVIGDYYSDLNHGRWISSDPVKINMLCDQWFEGSVFTNNVIIICGISAIVLIAATFTTIFLVKRKKK